MKVFNKRARFDYQLTPEKMEAGLVLKGIEAKAFREKRINLSGSHIRILNGEMYLINANISASGDPSYQPTRMRKLLLHRHQILSLETKMKQKKLIIVPISMYNTKTRIKLEIGLGKPKKQFEKKESIKRADVDREIERQLKDSY